MPSSPTPSTPSQPPLSQAPGPATIADVARVAGVSTATVSRALRDHPYVAAETRRKVLEAVTRLRYVANPNASRLASGSTGTIGLIAPVLTSWYTSELVAGVEEVLSEAEHDLLIGSASTRQRESMFRGDLQFRQRVDGIILVDVFCSEEGAVRLSAMGIPVVVLGERLRSVTSVAVDNAAGAALAAEHLVAAGHRDIALVEGQSHIDVAHNLPTERAAGFLGALRHHGLDVDPSLRADGGFTISGGRAAMHRLLDAPMRPSAVFLMSDEMAFGALQALRERSLTPGRDIAVVGFDDHPVAESVGLTTVRQHVREIGRIGARLMQERLEGSGATRHVAAPLELVVRETSRP